MDNIENFTLFMLNLFSKNDLEQLRYGLHDDLIWIQNTDNKTVFVYPIFWEKIDGFIDLSGNSSLGPVKKKEVLDKARSISTVLDLRSIDGLLLEDHLIELKINDFPLLIIRTNMPKHIYLLRKNYYVDYPEKIEAYPTYKKPKEADFLLDGSNKDRYRPNKEKEKIASWIHLH